MQPRLGAHGQISDGENPCRPLCGEPGCTQESALLKRKGDTKWGLEAISSEPQSRLAVLQELGVQVPKQAYALEMNRTHLTIFPGPHSVSATLPLRDNWRLSRLSLGPAMPRQSLGFPSLATSWSTRSDSMGRACPVPGPVISPI